MATLFIYRHSPFQQADIKMLSQLITADDSLVLIDDGTYLLNHPSMDDFSEHKVYAITEHVEARALTLQPFVNRCSMSALVDLTFSHKNSVTL